MGQGGLRDLAMLYSEVYCLPCGLERSQRLEALRNIERQALRFNVQRRGELLIGLGNILRLLQPR